MTHLLPKSGKDGHLGMPAGGDFSAGKQARRRARQADVPCVPAALRERFPALVRSLSGRHCGGVSICISRLPRRLKLGIKFA